MLYPFLVKRFLFAFFPYILLSLLYGPIDMNTQADHTPSK